MTDSSLQLHEQPKEEGSPDVNELPLYGAQLAEVVLWQLNVERTEHPLTTEESSLPTFTANVNIAPSDDTQGQRAARLLLEYRFPVGETPAYIVHIELVGVFVQPTVSATTEDKETSETPRKLPQRELNDFTVMSLIWPYMRELLHQLQLRMRVPVFLLPTLDVANRQSVSHSTEQNVEQG